MTTRDGTMGRSFRWAWATELAAAALGIAAAFTTLAAKPALGGDGDGECCGGEEKKGDGAASGDKTDAAKDAAGGLLVDLGNKKCPIMGGKVNGKTWSEWNGLRIGHCCGMCPSKFAADPEKALTKAGIDWKDAAAAVKKASEAKGPDRDKAIAELKKKWTVVREPAAEAPAATGTLIDLGNAKCPVRGGAVDGKTYSEWNGLRIGHCCPGCGEKFLAHPEKSLADAKIEWKAAADAAKAVDAAKGADRVKALAELKKKWTVVREPAAEEPVTPEPPKK
jgi:hypothetical protein